MASNAEMVDYLMPISTNYVLGGSRYSPYDTDCSGVVCAGMWHVHGVDPYVLGDWTGAQWSWGVLSKIWWGTDPNLPWNIMQKGDHIFTSVSAPSFDTVNGSHVGLYTGDPNAPFLSHFANGGPYVTAVNGVYSGNERYFGVARYVPGSEEQMENPWTYKNKAMNGDKDTYQLLTDIHKQLTRTDNAGWGTPAGHDIYGRMNAIEKAVDNLKLAGGAAIDYDKLAKSLAPVVADELSARLKA